MRIGELLHSTVMDGAGRSVGHVHDVRLVQDGPLMEGFGAALRIAGLVVGSGGGAVRLGYHRHRVRGPFLVKKLFTTIEARARYVPWEQVERWDGRTVTLRCGADELSRLEDVY